MTNPSIEGSGDDVLRVVVAEDEALIRLDLVEALRESGYDVVGEASDGETALELIRDRGPDVALLDISMPLLDGLSVAKAVSEDMVCAVVIVTAHSQRELVSRAAEAGAMAYVVKPFTPRELAPAIELARTRFQEIVALQADVGDLAERLEGRRLVDRAKAALIAAYGLTEAEAFRLMQKRAMDERSSMAAVARQVLRLDDDRD